MSKIQIKKIGHGGILNAIIEWQNEDENRVICRECGEELSPCFDYDNNEGYVVCMYNHIRITVPQEVIENHRKIHPEDFNNSMFVLANNICSETLGFKKSNVKFTDLYYDKLLKKSKECNSIG